MVLARRLLMGGGSFTPGDGMDLGWTNVKDHGAVGDGIADDTTAITTAIAALPSTGAVLYFPPGTYLTSGGFTISVPCTVLGMGGGGGRQLDYQPSDLPIPYISQVQCNSQTAHLFTVTSGKVDFIDLSLVNVYAGVPSAGSAINVASGGGTDASYIGVTIAEFYTGLVNSYGRGWIFDKCYIINPVLFGMTIQNVDGIDIGWGSVTNSFFYCIDRDITAHIWIGSGGGIKIMGNWFAGGGATYNATATYGVQLAVQNSVVSSDLIIANNHMENISGACIRADTSPTASAWKFIQIVGNHLANYQVGSVAAIWFDADGQYDLEDIVISDNILFGYLSGTHAINLTNVRRAVVVGNLFADWSGGLITTSGCTNINSSVGNYS